MKRTSRQSRWNRILVIVFFLTAIVLAIWGSFVFKSMIEDDDLQQRLDEVRPPADRPPTDKS